MYACTSAIACTSKTGAGTRRTGERCYTVGRDCIARRVAQSASTQQTRRPRAGEPARPYILAFQRPALERRAVAEARALEDALRAPQRERRAPAAPARDSDRFQRYWQFDARS